MVILGLKWPEIPCVAVVLGPLTPVLGAIFHPDRGLRPPKLVFGAHNTYQEVPNPPWDGP